MRLILSVLLLLSGFSYAQPVEAAPQLKLFYFYDAKHPPKLFTNPTCTLSRYLQDGEPFQTFFPFANFLGLLVAPVLDAIIGHDLVEKFDDLADQDCINAQQTPNEGNGRCADLQQAIKDFVNDKVPATKAKKYRCLLDLLCIAPEGPKDEGTCNDLLAGIDCVANRIIGADFKECQFPP